MQVSGNCQHILTYVGMYVHHTAGTYSHHYSVLHVNNEVVHPVNSIVQWIKYRLICIQRMIRNNRV